MSDTATRLRNVLLASATVTNLIDRKVFQARAPQKKSHPYVWLNRRGVEDDGCLDSPVGDDAQEEYFDVECWAKELDDAQAIAAAIRGVLHNKYGTFDDTTVAAVMVNDQDDSYEPQGAADDDLFVAALDVQISYN